MKSFSSWEGWKGKKCNLSSYLLLLCVEMIFITMLLQSTLSFSDGWNKKKDENTNAATCNFLDRKCKNGSHDLISQLFKRSWRARALLNIGKEGDFICSNLLISTSLFFYQTP